MTTIIIDDEPLAVKLLAHYVNKHPDLTGGPTFTNPVDGLDYLRRNPTDLLLLDIQMKELNGLHVARLVRGQTKVIFTTAYEEHALESFDLDAVDYLLKPINYDRFERAIAKVLNTRPSPHQAPLSTVSAPAAAPDHVFVKSGNRTVKITLKDLLYGSSCGDYLSLHLAHGSKILTLENLGSFVGRLPDGPLCRIHRSHFVNLKAIDFVERRRVVIGKTWLPVSDGYRAAFVDLLER